MTYLIVIMASVELLRQFASTEPFAYGPITSNGTAAIERHYNAPPNGQRFC